MVSYQTATEYAAPPSIDDASLPTSINNITLIWVVRMYRFSSRTAADTTKTVAEVSENFLKGLEGRKILEF